MTTTMWMSLRRLWMVPLLLVALNISSVSSLNNQKAERPLGGKSPAHERHLQECNVNLANWTVDELSNYLDSVIDASLGDASTEASIAKLTLLSALKHGVSIRRMCASCSDFSSQTQPAAYADFCTGYGADTSFSGLLMLPLLEDGSVLNGTLPGGIWLHGTSTQSVPSIEFRGVDSGIDLMVNAAIASTGAITMMPDYMGYGESSGQVFKAYLVKRQYHTSIIPLWLMAGRMIQEETDCKSALADSAAILGYSEGGYAAVALAEGLYNMGVDILKVEAGAGPYRMGSAALLEGQRFVNEGVFPLEVREYFALVGAAYSSTYPELANFEEGQDMLASDARDAIVELITNSASKAEVQALIPTDDPTSVFSPQLVEFSQNALVDGDSDPCNNAARVIQGVNDKICEALQDNDLTELLETTPYPVRLCHSPDDDVVSYANLPDFDTNVLLERLDSTGNHVEAATTCLLQSVLFMLSDGFLGASIIEKTSGMGCFAAEQQPAVTDVPEEATTVVDEKTTGATVDPVLSTAPDEKETTAAITDTPLGDGLALDLTASPAPSMEETVDTNMPTSSNTGTEMPAPPSPTPPPPPPVTYAPGLLTVEENGLVLSEGLTSRLIATRRQPVEYSNGSLSVDPFHRRPDYGACFPVPPDATENLGGWVYVSNSELGGPPSGQGGVGALYFDKDGNIIDYKMLLRNTTTNCAGGRTPWGTFISCEEVTDIGKIYQVDPFDRRPPEQITMGKLGGRYESFTHDDRDKNAPRFFATEDKRDGPTIRWTPDPESIDWEEPWDMLASGSGTMEYLYLKPDPANKNASGTFEWTTNLERARQNAELYAQGTEGIDRNENLLYFVCKTDSLFYILDLDRMTFVMYPANIGLFDGEPDQVNRMVNDTQDILYFTEAGTAGISGIHGRNSKGQYFTILESPGYETEETTGLAFSPNGLHMYVALQDPGVLFDITRTDGYPFHGLSLEVRYHNPPLDHLLRP